MSNLVKLGIHVLRIGRKNRIRHDLQRFTLGPRGEHNYQFRQARVICSTLMGSGLADLKQLEFPAILVDEAAQCTEPETLIPICKGGAHVILSGDHRQLPPVVFSDDAMQSHLDLSLFERLLWEKVDSVTLDTQYRMHPSISEFPRLMFYQNDCPLFDGVGITSFKTKIPFPWPAMDVPVCFVHTPAPEEREEGASWTNRPQARIVASIIQSLAKAGFPSKAQEGEAIIGVAAPYRAQVDLLRELLPNVEALSIDAWQGREARLMIVSTVRSNSYQQLGFLRDQRRANVVLTRAQEGLILIGNKDMLASDGRVWGPWLTQAVAKNLVMEWPCLA